MATLEDQFRFSIDPESLCVDVFATVGSLIAYVRSHMHDR
jgi:acyl carrier protein